MNYKIMTFINFQICKTNLLLIAIFEDFSVKKTV